MYTGQITDKLMADIKFKYTCDMALTKVFTTVVLNIEFFILVSTFFILQFFIFLPYYKAALHLR